MEEINYQITKSYASEWLTSDYKPLEVLKQAYQVNSIKELEKNEVRSYLTDTFIKDIALKGITKENFPDKIILNDVYDMIFRNYSFLSPIEIDLALKMERYGELEDEKGEKIKHFHFYGTEYVVEILKRYVNWRLNKAKQYDLSRKINQIEVKPDFNKIDEDYLKLILSEIKKGKDFRYINAHLLYKNIPKEFKLSEKDALKLFNSEKKKYESEFYKKRDKEKDRIYLKKLEVNFKKGFDQILKERCRNIVTCEYLVKQHNLEK